MFAGFSRTSRGVGKVVCTWRRHRIRSVKQTFRAGAASAEGTRVGWGQDGLSANGKAAAEKVGRVRGMSCTWILQVGKLLQLGASVCELGSAESEVGGWISI